MAGLENLIHSIYHEKQQDGSMLCAQHALNSLLQENFFTAPDLSDIARNLDALEHSYDETHSESTNMDDTGFFSVQVLDNALKIWGLNLARWRGEEMRPYQDHPQTQLAFILNLDQHWFTLRRFGYAESNLDNDPGDGHWFNLNSSLPAPEWVGRLYLGMVLQQAESDGYSVFAVTQADPSAPLALPRTPADHIASTLPQPTSARQFSQRLSSSTAPPPQSLTTAKPGHIEGFEDEEYELQAALQASLMNYGGSLNFDAPPPGLTPSFTSFPPPYASDPVPQIPTPTHHNHRPPARELPSILPSPPASASVDPVAASTERNKLMLQRMKEEQEDAQRELWAESVTTPEATVALEARRAEWNREAEEEAKMLRRAIEESQAMAEPQRPWRAGEEEGDRTGKRRAEGNDTDEVEFDSRIPHHPGKSDFFSHDRVYDDDDAELQAALQASLEQVPDGWLLPEAPEHPTPQHPSSSSRPSSEEDQTTSPRDNEDLESVVSDGTTTDMIATSQSDISLETVGVDELRRRRLARFGA